MALELLQRTRRIIAPKRVSVKQSIHQATPHTNMFSTGGGLGARTGDLPTRRIGDLRMVLMDDLRVLTPIGSLKT